MIIMLNELENLRDKLDIVNNLLSISHDYCENYELDDEKFMFINTLTKVILDNSLQNRRDLSIICDILGNSAQNKRTPI